MPIFGYRLLSKSAMQGDGMNKGSGMSVWMRGLLIMLFAVMCHAGTAQATTAEQFADQNTADILTDTNIATTCDNEAVRDQQLGLGAYKQRIESELRNVEKIKGSIDYADQINQQLKDLYFCPLKISGIVDIVSMASSIAGGIMAAVIAAVTSYVTTLLTNLVAGICRAIMTAMNNALALICIPNADFQLNLKAPDFNFGGKAQRCGGTPLAVITGGPSLPTPPSSFGTSIPGTKFQGRINIIK